MCRGAAKLEHLKNVCGTAGHPCAWQQCWDEGAGCPNPHIFILWHDSLIPSAQELSLWGYHGQVAALEKTKAALQGLILPEQNVK